MNNFKKVVTMVLAFAMVLTCVMVTPAQAAGKLNKATASIYAGETVQLKAKVKSVTWGSSNKKVAKVLFCKLNDAPVVTLNDAITV